MKLYKKLLNFNSKSGGKNSYKFSKFPQYFAKKLQNRTDLIKKQL